MRIIHACGMVEIAAGSRLLRRRGAGRHRGAGRRARRSSATPTWWPTASPAPACRADNEVICTLADPRVAGARAETGHDAHGGGDGVLARRISPAPWSPSAMRRPRCSACWKCWTPARRIPRCIIGMPVGFVGAAESKEALIADGARARHRGARAQGRQRDGRGGRQRAGERKRMSMRPSLRRRARPRRSRTADRQGGAADRDRAGHRLFRQGGPARQCARHRRPLDTSAAPRNCRSIIR